jgi:hypothetical protein
MPKLRFVLSTVALGLGVLAVAPARADADECRQRVELNDLPAPVRTTIDQQAQGGKTDELAKLSDDGSLYKAEITGANGQQREIYIDSQGKVIGMHVEQ